MPPPKENKWQDRTFDIQESLCHMYKYAIFPDVTIQCTDDAGSTMCFSAHRLVLALRSPVWADTFYSKIQKSRIVSITLNPRIMDILLWYIYSDVIDEANVEELTESFQAATQYKIGGFAESCIEKLLGSSSLDASNAYSVLEIADVSTSEGLHNKCIQYIINNPESALLSETFQSLSEEILGGIVREINQSVPPQTMLTAMIKWMTRNNFMDRKFLTTIEFSLFSADDFLNIVEAHPNFFSTDEKHSLLRNLMIPESSELPEWCKFSKTRVRCVKTALTPPQRVMERIKERAVRVKTVCRRPFSKVSFHGMGGFRHDLLLKVSVQSRALSLVMMELAFGSDYAPAENLNTELRSNAGRSRKMRAIQHYLVPSGNHYYLLPCSGTAPIDGDDVNLLLSVESSGLGAWGPNGPVSDLRFRPASASGRKSLTLETSCDRAIVPSISLKPFEDWFLLADPKSGDKEFLISALYFDTSKNARQYLTNVEEKSS